MAYPAIVFGPWGRLDKVTRRIESQVRPHLLHPFSRRMPSGFCNGKVTFVMCPFNLSYFNPTLSAFVKDECTEAIFSALEVHGCGVTNRRNILQVQF